MKADWFHQSLHATVFANFLDADSRSLLAVGSNGEPISFAFETNTYNADASNTGVIADRHVVTYGVNARNSDFDLSIARRGNSRSEWGAFIQDEVLWSRARWMAGARVDHIDPIGVVISPRTAFLFSPSDRHTMRISFGRAYRAPSLVNNYLDTSIRSTVSLPTGPFAFSTEAYGNEDLNEEQLDAYEVGYIGNVGHVTVTMSLYRNVKRDSVDFFPASFYTASHPPSGWPLPTAVLDLPPVRSALPSAFSYRNVGKVINRGFELAFQGRPAAQWSWFSNYSYQADPRIDGVSEPGLHQRPPRHLLNAGGSYDRGNYFVSATVNYQDKAFWTDVLDSRYWGPTRHFTCVNVAAGIRIRDRTTVSVTATNLFDQAIQ